MSYAHHVEQFHGLPAYNFPPYADPAALPPADAVAWRFEREPYDFEEDADVCWKRFTESVEMEKVRAMIFGQPWYDGDGGMSDDGLIQLAPRLTALEALFLGDLEDEQAMISTIYQSDLAPLLAAFPHLKELAIRGGEGLDFPVSGHDELRVLRVESGGLPPHAAEHIAAARLPSLERLELWLGDENYGGGVTVEQLAPLFAGEGKPALRHLGLQNSFIQDELAVALGAATVVPQLTSLSLSMGTLSDDGAEALLQGQPLTHLHELDLSFHFLSHAMMLRLWTALEPAGVRVNLTVRHQAEPDDWDEDGRYIAASE
ncbi:STM4015 family protein [Streptomyces sp. NBC_01498]|uniref:STM4015 family protein n=1 Tax=Streptomyces sp. NBC_01498 TaxID=2975870 RepID=UPI002E7B1B63|nr:STM4015 family protein [Streptomyces sp. NBC_01498]WTL25323.1 STM4015 family protein [Streptomyces sp. NBC_01498]